MVGKTVSHYKILEKLDSGGMGVVYKAEDTCLGRHVALKFLPEKYFGDPAALKRFEREARSASALNHPHICTIHDIGTHEGQPFIVMECLDGATLRNRMRDRPLETDEAVKLAFQVTDALKTAHLEGIIHRDIKPANIFITLRGDAKILDFGLAKRSDPTSDIETHDSTATTTLTDGHMNPGTLPYMSPEQVAGKPIDTRSDIFSLGLVLYEMLTGVHPFMKDSSIETASAILSDTPPPLSRYKAGIPELLEHTVGKMLAKKPESRYQMIHEVQTNLNNVSAGHSSATQTVDPHRRTAPTLGLYGLLLTIALIVTLIAVLGLDLGNWRDRLLGTASSGPIQSLAVLPLTNFSGDPGQEYFTDGMTDILIANLSKIGALHVISQTSAMRYKETDMSLPEIAQELNVDAIVEGGAALEGDRVRINARLIEGATENNLWNEQYVRQFKDVLTLQSEVAQSIAREIAISLTPEEEESLTTVQPVNPEAHQSYLKGRYYWNKRPAEIQQAEAHFLKALDTDPAYARAYAGLADYYSFLGMGGLAVLPPLQAMPKAKVYATDALQLDDTLAEAHTSLGMIKLSYDWDWSGAEEEFRRALDLNPGYATTYQWYGIYLALMGKEKEAIEQVQHAQELDPFSPMIGMTRGRVFYYARQYELAIEQLEKTLELDPSFLPTYHFLGLAYEEMGRTDEAVEVFQKSAGLDPLFLTMLGHAYGLNGDTAEAREVLTQLEEFSQSRYLPAVYRALVYVGLGEKDQAFEWLEKAYEERSDWMTFLKVDSAVDILRPDPRFLDLLQRVGFVDPVVVP